MGSKTQVLKTPKSKRSNRSASTQKLQWDRFALDFDKRTLISGVLNCTPDSFSDGGRFLSTDKAILHALEMARDGADIIDIGGESTRPGSLPVTEKEELFRVMPVIKRLSAILDIPISIDTNKAAVAEAALKNGAAMINDITGLKGDPGMADVVARYGVPLVVMHIKGSPETMQVDPQYDDTLAEVLTGLKESVEIAKSAGVDENVIIVDPGIGFGKRLPDNVEIIKRLSEFKELGRPIMVGLSRKSFIGQLTGRDIHQRSIGTAAGTVLAIANGADIIRAHDIRQTKDAAKVADSICKR